MPLSTIATALIGGVVSAVLAPSPQPTLQQLQELAAVRPFPAEAKRGEMQPPMQGIVVINGRSMYLTPGAQIRNTENRIVMPSTVQDTAIVRYLTDSSGAVSRVWMLSPAEAAAPDQPQTSN